MKNGTPHNYKLQISRWLLALVLCLNGFLAPGYSQHSKIFHEQAVKTEVVYTASARRLRRAGTYRQALQELFSVTDFLNLYRAIILEFDRRVNILFAYLNKQKIPLHRFLRSLQIRYSTKKSDDLLLINPAV